MNEDPENFTTPNPLLVCSVDVSSDGKTLAIGQQGDAESKLALSLWSLEGHQLQTTLVTAEGVTPIARFSPGGSLLAYTNAGQRLVLRDLKSGSDNIISFALPFTKWMSFASKRDRLIAGGTRTQVWDADTRTVIWTLPVNPFPSAANISPPACAIDAEGARVAASGVEPREVIVYEIDSGNIITRIPTTMDDARSMAFDPNGQFIAAVSTGGGAGVWDLRNGDPVLPDKLKMDADYYWCARFHPDGNHLALGLWSGFVEMIRLSDGERVIHQDVSPAHNGRVRDLAFSHDGSRLFSGGEDGVVLVWDTATASPGSDTLVS